MGFRNLSKKCFTVFVKHLPLFERCFDSKSITQIQLWIKWVKCRDKMLCVSEKAGLRRIIAPLIGVFIWWCFCVRVPDCPVCTLLDRIDDRSMCMDCFGFMCVESFGADIRGYGKGFVFSDELACMCLQMLFVV